MLIRKCWTWRLCSSVSQSLPSGRSQSAQTSLRLSLVNRSRYNLSLSRAKSSGKYRAALTNVARILFTGKLWTLVYKMLLLIYVNNNIFVKKVSLFLNPHKKVVRFSLNIANTRWFTIHHRYLLIYVYLQTCKLLTKRLNQIVIYFKLGNIDTYM